MRLFRSRSSAAPSLRSRERTRFFIWAIVATVTTVVSCVGFYAFDPYGLFGPQPSHGKTTIGGRSQVAVCVAFVDVDMVDRSSVLATVNTAIKTLHQDPAAWSRIDRTGTTPRVDAGCPSKPAALTPDVQLARGGIRTIRTIPNKTFVTSPSPYILMVFIIPQSVSDDVFHGYPAFARNETQEWRCNTPDGRPGEQREVECSTVTDGLYLTPAESTRLDIVENALAVVLNQKSREDGYETYVRIGEPIP